ncbi:MAG: flagellar type III secretion system protein FlhB [Pseudomonadota bacterium]
MAEDNDSSDKSLDATPQRIAQARKEGNVPQSPELLTLARYTGAFIAVAGVAGALSQTMAISWAGFFISPMETIEHLMKGGTVLSMFSETALFFIAVVGVGAVLAIVALVAQQAITFAPKKIKPDLKRLSLIKNAGKKFGPAGLIDFLKNTVKSIAIISVALIIANMQLPEMMASVGAKPALLIPEMGQLLKTMLIAAVLLAALAAAIDVPLKWQQHRKQLRMSYQDVKDETKEIEGDPTQRSAIRAKARELAQNRQLADVPGADVIVVNPEHYAVALKCDRTAGEVPRCIAKGVDHMAFRIREIATDSDVPIYRDVPTARSLYATVEVGDEINREHYEAVAAAIRFADGLKKTKS